MALAFRTGSFVSNGNLSGGDLTLTKPTGTADGDRVVINVYFEPDTTTITVSNGPWESFTIANTGAFKLQCFTKIASSEPASYTISNDTAGDQWRVAVGGAYSGGTGSGTQIDAASAGSQGDAVTPESNQTAPSITPNGTNRMIVFAYGNYGGGNVTAMGGFCSNLRGQLGGTTLADALQATASATGTTYPTGQGTQDYAAAHVALISDIAGGPSALNVAVVPSDAAYARNTLKVVG